MIRSLVTIVVLAFLLNTPDVSSCDRNDATSHRLFYIARSKGPAIVCYDAVVKDGKLCTDDPIDVYWEHPQRRSEREELNWIERWQAYGVDITRTFNGADSVDILMRANKKPVRVVQRNGQWMALTYINNKVCQLQSVYVSTDDSGIMPKVLYVKLTGKVRWSDEVISEIIKPEN